CGGPRRQVLRCVTQVQQALVVVEHAVCLRPKRGDSRFVWHTWPNYSRIALGSEEVDVAAFGKPKSTYLLLLFPVALLVIGTVLLALVRRQIVDWQTLTGALLFAAGL